MEAKLLSLSDFLIQPKTQFIIPVYQRNYDWTETQCRQLLKDIYSVGRNDNYISHFIGSVVFIHDGVYSSAGKRLLTIIDGQQRLTTMTLILYVLSLKAREIGNEKLANELFEDYVINKRFDEEKIKLRPVKKDDKALKYIIENSENDTFDGYSRIIENFNYFKSEIPQEDTDVLLKGISKLVFVEISLERQKDDPQRIFESLNSTGLDLSQADLIRNYVLMDLSPKDQNRIYDKYWFEIENLTIEDRSKQTKLSDFIRDFLTFKFRDIPNKNKVFDEFKKRYNFNNINYLEEVLVDLKNYAKYYSKLINPEVESNIEIRERLKQINKLEINVVYPFLLEVYDDYINNVIDTQAFIEALDLIQSFVWRRFICGLPTNALNKIFMRLYEDITDKSKYVYCLQLSLLMKKGQQRFPTNEEIEAELKVKDFYNIQSKNRIYFLERLENYNNNEPVIIEGNDDITVEHIFPQKPSLEWRKDLGEKFAEFQLKYTHIIANLTLSGNNGELGNKSFIEKRDMPEKGYKASRLFLNKYLSSLNKWTEVELLKRLRILTERIELIWSYPQISVDLKEINEEINLFDIEDATSNQIDYAIFDNKKYTNMSYVELYGQIAKYLFEFDPNVFLNNNLAQKLKLTKDKETLRRPVKISPLYYIEGHGNSNAILERLKKILQAFENIDDLYIKFI